MKEYHHHIAFLCTSKSLGGLELNALRVGLWLKERNWVVTLFANRNAPLFKMAIQNGLPVESAHWNVRYADFPAAARLYAGLKKKNIRILYVLDNKDISLAVNTKLISLGSIKVIYHQQMQIGVDKKDILHTLRYSFLDFWLSPLPWLAEEVRQKTRMRPGRIRVVPHGMEMEPFIHLTLSKKEARAKLGLPLEAFLIGCIGRIDPGKGQLMLVKALERIRQVNARVELVLVGEPTRNETNLYYAQICQFITDSNLKGYVHLRPFSDDVALYFKSFDLFALASAKETYGLVTLESMASGIPVIGTNSGGTPEILKQGELGYLFPPGDVDEFCRLVLHIIDHPEEASRKAKEALLHVKACFAHTAECDLLESIFLPLRR